MKPMDLLMEIGWAEDQDILSAQTPVTRKKPGKLWLLAAVIALTAVLAGCTAVYLLELHNLKLGENTQVLPQWGGQVIEGPTGEGGNRRVTLVEGEYQGETEVTRQVFSLGSLRGTPEFKAAQEWFQFLKTFDPDYRISEAHRLKWLEAKEKDPDFESFFPEEYACYGVYDQTMVEEVDRIAEKYDLRKLTGWKSQWYDFQETGLDRILRFTGVDHFFRPGSELSLSSISSSRITEEKRFYMYGNLAHAWEGIPETWDGEPYQPLFQVNFVPRGIFDPEIFRMDREERFQEENYVTGSGDQVLILQALEGVNSMLFCQREDAMVVLTVESRMDLYYEDENGVDHADCTYLTMDQLQEIADGFDFGLQLDPDWDYVEEEHRDYRKILKEREQEQRKREATAPTDDPRDG